MDIFISWSGERSRACADALKVWLPRIIQSVKPWVSTRDLGKGARWSSDLSKQLDQHIYGIIIVTPENRHSTWLNFEAGALSKTDVSRTFTFLLGLDHSEVEQPLAQFNHTLAVREDVLSLMRSINQAGDTHLDDELLLHTFELNWPYLEEIFAGQISLGIPKDERAISNKEVKPRDEKSMIQEILELTRLQALRRPASIRDRGESPRVEMLRELVLRAIRNRSVKLSFRVQDFSGTAVLVELRDEKQRFHFEVDLSDSMALIEQSVERALDRFVARNVDSIGLN